MLWVLIRIAFAGHFHWLLWYIILPYGKCPKISNMLFYTILAWIVLLMQLFLKYLVEWQTV